MAHLCSLAADFYSIGFLKNRPALAPWWDPNLTTNTAGLVAQVIMFNQAAVWRVRQYYTILHPLPSPPRSHPSSKKYTYRCVCGYKSVCACGRQTEQVFERVPCSWFGCTTNSYQDESCLNRFLSSLFALRFTCACKWCWLRVIWLFNCWTAATLAADCHCRLSQ